MTDTIEQQADEAADNDELHNEQAESEQTEQPAEPEQAETVQDTDDDEPQAVNPQPAQRLAEPEPVAEPEPAPAKRGRGRPRKVDPTPAAIDPTPAATEATPPKPKSKAKPKLPDIGAAVAPQLDEKRRQQLDAVKGLLQLQASKIASLACLAVGWEPLNNEESLLVDAEFDGWTPPEEMRKVVIVGIVALPRALGDNRCRKLVGLPLLGASGDAPAARAAEVAASVAPPPVAPPPVEPSPTMAQAQPAEPAAQPAEEQRSDDLVNMVSPLFAGVGAARVPKGFV